MVQVDFVSPFTAMLGWAAALAMQDKQGLGGMAAPAVEAGVAVLGLQEAEAGTAGMA